MSATGLGPDLAGAATGGRRLIAVVYADMVGYSHLISLDDAGTLRRLRTIRRALIDPAIREHGGRVVQTGGDSLLVAFDSIDGAVRCAVKVQQQVPAYDGDQPPGHRMRFRVGINIGDVIPHGTDLHGDGVNIAARLQAECPVGGICVSRTVRDHVHGRLHLEFEPIGPLTLKNIARPVEAFVVRLDPAAEAVAPVAAQRPRKVLFLSATGLVLVSAAVVAWLLHHGPSTIQQAQAPLATTEPAATTSVSSKPQPPRLSVVVLPFQNLSGDAGQDYLADGVTEDLTTDLSNLPGLYVVSRQSAYTYKDKSLNMHKVGEELGVRYAIEGSVRKLGDVLRVNAQLIATESGAHLWAERFDHRLSDLSAGQEEIVRRIGQTLDVALADIESARSKRERPTNPDAFDLILRARALALHPVGPREVREQLALYEEALRLDPTSIRAMTGVANILIRSGSEGDKYERTAKLLADAAAINPNYPGVLANTGYMLMRQSRCTESIAVYRRLLDEYPNSPFAYNQIGDCLNRLGRVAEAVPMIETAIRTELRSPFNWSRYGNLGWSLLMLGRDEESISWNQRALAANPNLYSEGRAQFHIRIAAAQARLGHLDDGRRELAEADRIWPYDTIRSHCPDEPSSRAAAEQIEGYQAALRLAGHRDHADPDADFSVSPDDKLHGGDAAGLTPTSVPGATTIPTVELARMLAGQNLIVIDSLLCSWGRSIPSAIGLRNAGSGASGSDSISDRLRRKMLALTKGDLSAPIVAVGLNSERFDGRNLALRLVAIGYINVYWYRGGREAWEVAGLPETPVDVQDW